MCHLVNTSDLLGCDAVYLSSQDVGRFLRNVVVHQTIRHGVPEHNITVTYDRLHITLVTR
jgi:hypothetical protein